jgi:glutathione peroxidase
VLGDPWSRPTTESGATLYSGKTDTSGSGAEWSGPFATGLGFRYATDTVRRLGEPMGDNMKTTRRAGVRQSLFLGLVLMTATSMFAGSGIYEFTLPSIDGQPMPLANFKGKVILLVNVASRCGFTPQYTGLEALYEKYKDQGFVILGFPANNFGGQEPGTNQEIKTFCSTKYNVTFPIYGKVSVKGADQTPLYQYLTKEADPSHTGDIKWNFTKFLVDRNGSVVERFEPNVTPESENVVTSVEKLLKQ